MRLSVPEDSTLSDVPDPAKLDWLDHYLEDIAMEFDWATCTVALDVVNEI